MTRQLRIATIVPPVIVGLGLLIAPPAGAQVPQAPAPDASVRGGPPPPGPHDHAGAPNSLPDQNAAQEPTAKAKPDTPPGVFVNGALAVPGAPTQSETRPAKFSAENDVRDKIPIMARGPQLTDDQKREIAETLRRTPSASGRVDAGPAMELPASVELMDWPPDLVGRVPALRGTKYARIADRIMIVQSPNRIVVGEIAP